MDKRNAKENNGEHDSNNDQQSKLLKLFYHQVCARAYLTQGRKSQLAKIKLEAVFLRLTALCTNIFDSTTFTTTMYKDAVFHSHEQA